MDDYPKWIAAPNGRRCVVPDAATEEAVLAGKVVPPTPPKSAQGGDVIIVPSVSGGS